MSKNGKAPYSPLLDEMFGTKEKEGRIVDWACVDSTLISDLVHICTPLGVAVLFGFTPDRGAWSLCFMGDIVPLNKNGKRAQPVYCNSEDMLEAWITEWIQKWSRVASKAAE